ncbi:MAG: hypothetical protein MR432_05925 [Prevotellaceae bacterium]|nr:hypothetical protein [Prevotellaceae bacterium]
MALEPITRKEKIIAGQDLTPITRMEKFLKQYGGGGGGGSVPTTGAVTTLHINVTAINPETMDVTFTADKTPNEILQASVNGPIWCVVTFESGTMADHTVSICLPPAGVGAKLTFGLVINRGHDANGDNEIFYAVSQKSSAAWTVNLNAFLS